MLFWGGGWGVEVGVGEVVSVCFVCVGEGAVMSRLSAAAALASTNQTNPTQANPARPLT